MTTRDELFPGTDPTSTAHREFDWSTTSLGPVEHWPAALVSAIRTVLPSEVGMLLWWGDDLVQIFNHAYTPMAGELFPKAVGQRAEDCWHFAWDAIGPLADEALGGTAVHRRRERFLLDRFGYPEETYFTFSYSPIRGEGDTVNGVFVATSDVTQEVLTERRLATLRDLGTVSVTAAAGVDSVCRAVLSRLSENRDDVPFAAAYLVGDDGLREVASFDTADAVLSTTDLGDVASRVAASGVAETVTVGPTSALVQPLLASSDAPTGVLVTGTSELRRVDDHYRVFLELVAGRITTALTDAHSYAAERRRAAQLEELDADKTRFFENVSHEFRTPLTLLLGPLDAVLSEAADHLDDRHVQALQSARRSALRLQKLVDTLLDVARADAGELRPRPEPTDAAALIRDAVNLFRDSTDRAGVELTIDSDTGGTLLDLDRTLWTHLVMNLVSNAVKFTTRGSIRVTLRGPVAEVDGARRLVLEVADTGPGVPEADRGKIFERFYQVAGVSGRSREGSGVGLSLVSDIVAALGGTVEVTDNAPHGTVFTVVVPTTTADAEPDTVAPTDLVTDLGARYVGEAEQWRPIDSDGTRSTQAPPTDGQRRVLLVEDNADMRRYVTGLLEDQGWHVAATDEVDTALATARATPPDIIVSDIMLPGRSGLSLVDEARSDGRLVRVPIVLVSARTGSAQVIEGLRIGADDYVVKPFQPAEFVARVRVHLELARLREQLLGDAQREISSLRIALDSRSVLSQAVGLIMAQENVGPDRAFEIIAKRSQTDNVKARILAAQVVDDFVRELG
ncbi:ATP-binding protein [Rhodococcoides corynebacterioides]|uniref:ATP-binding protein n=1 Tax=Rhodococcoides corynebacterioides TaxID=53972 RepID=UPI001C9ADBE5|nr:ATP-binding protein [Rhodococcus corynebacterioides]MBY6361935.1 response regulator [Rhodococcus corynebacterioides]